MYNLIFAYVVSMDCLLQNTKLKPILSLNIAEKSNLSSELFEILLLEFLKFSPCKLHKICNTSPVNFHRKINCNEFNSHK